jgi:indoleamine 2,3-dioxygenase
MTPLNRRDSDAAPLDDAQVEFVPQKYKLNGPKERCAPVVPLSSSTLALLAKFDVHPVRGFLPAEDPLLRLPQPELQPWENLVADLPALLSAVQARQPLAALPVLPTALLQNERQKRRALLILSMLCHAFVWGDPDKPVDVIPAGIAVPLWQLGRELGVPPLLTHLSIVLYNWRRLDPQGPISINNLTTACQFLGGQDEAWFYLITAEIEAHGGAAMGPLLQAQEAVVAAQSAVQQQSAAELAAALKQLEACLLAVAVCVDAMRGALKRMTRGCHPYAFYHRVRPFLSGWRANPTLPRGVAYAGLNDDSKADTSNSSNSSNSSSSSEDSMARHFYYGGSAAQSTLFAALDAGLGIGHAKGAGSSFLADMRDYMPPKHRAFLVHLESPGTPSVRDFVLGLDPSAAGTTAAAAAGAATAAVAAAYDTAVQAVEAFRTAHLGIVTVYILQQQRRERELQHSVTVAAVSSEVISSSGSGGSSSDSGTDSATSSSSEVYGREKAAGGKGTGGTDLLEFLKPLRDDAKAAVLNSSKR